MKRAKKLSLLIAVLVLAGGGYAISRFMRAKDFRYAGTIEATRVDVPARLATVVKSVEVQEGQKIAKGAKLASLACEEIRIAARLASENYERAVKLRRAGSLAQEAFEQTQSRKEESDARLSWCDIQAPVSGTILTRFIEPSEWVNPGAKIVSMADLSDVWAYIYVPQEVMSRLRMGAEVRGLIPELGQKTFQGTIRKINEEAEFTPKNVQTQAERTRLVFGVKVSFANADEVLKPGMSIEIDLGLGQPKE